MNTYTNTSVDTSITVDMVKLAIAAEDANRIAEIKQLSGVRFILLRGVNLAGTKEERQAQAQAIFDRYNEGVKILQDYKVYRTPPIVKDTACPWVCETTVKMHLNKEYGQKWTNGLTIAHTTEEYWFKKDQIVIVTLVKRAKPIDNCYKPVN